MPSCQGSYNTLPEVVVLEQPVQIASCAPTICTEPAIFVRGRRLKSVGATPAVPSCYHCTPYVNLVCLEALPAHVGKETTYGRRIYLGLALQRDLLVDGLEKGFDW